MSGRHPLQDRQLHHVPQQQHRALHHYQLRRARLAFTPSAQSGGSSSTRRSPRHQNCPARQPNSTRHLPLHLGLLFHQGWPHTPKNHSFVRQPLPSTRVPHFSRPLREVGLCLLLVLQTKTLSFRTGLKAHSSVIPNRAESPVRNPLFNPRPTLAPCQTTQPFVIPNRAESPVRNPLFNPRPTSGRRPPPSPHPSYFLQNLPTPTLTCTVFSPGFGTASPAFEICKYHTSTLQLYFSPRMCVPNAALGLKFTVFVYVGTL
jgi:hypothetical protein